MLMTKMNISRCLHALWFRILRVKQMEKADYEFLQFCRNGDPNRRMLRRELLVRSASLVAPALRSLTCSVPVK